MNDRSTRLFAEQNQRLTSKIRIIPELVAMLVLLIFGFAVVAIRLMMVMDFAN